MDEMIQKLIEERARTWEQAKALLDREEAENRSLSAEEDEQFKRMTTAIQEMDKRIDELHGLNVANKKADEARAEYESMVAPDVRDAQEKRQKNAFQELLEGKRSHIDIDFSQVRSEPAKVDRGFQVRDLSTGTATAGGDTVPTSFVRSLYEHMVENSAIRQTNVTVLTTQGGENLEVPKTAVYGTAAIVGEGTALAEADPTFGKVTLGSWKYGQLVQVTNELLTDSGVDVQGFLARDLGRALGNASGGHFITGSGTNQPNGVVTATLAQVGTGVDIASTTLTADGIIDLQYSVIEPYASRGYWMMRRATEGAVRKLKGSDNNYLWQPGLQAGSPNLLLGRPIVTDPNVAAVGSTNASVVFGDFSAYYIRDVAGVRIERSDDFAFSSDLVTWRAILRTDGDLIDATGAIQVLTSD